jgi:hypothetical protein
MYPIKYRRAQLNYTKKVLFFTQQHDKRIILYHLYTHALKYGDGIVSKVGNGERWREVENELNLCVAGMYELIWFK